MLVAGVAEEDAKAGLGKDDQVVILELAGGVDEMLAARDGEGGVEVVHQAPGAVVAVELGLLDTEGGELVGVVAKALRREDDLVEVFAGAGLL